MSGWRRDAGTPLPTIATRTVTSLPADASAPRHASTAHRILGEDFQLGESLLLVWDAQLGHRRARWEQPSEAAHLDGGSEFRLPVFKAVFHYSTRRAIALNLAVSLVTLVASFAIRLRVSPPGAFLPLLPVIVGLITGSILGTNSVGISMTVWLRCSLLQSVRP